jgi:uncharacterized RDD family membrane protein YckC
MLCAKCGAMLPEQAAVCPVCSQPATFVSSLAGTPRPVAYAGFWLRFVAYMVDWAVLTLATLLILFPFVVLTRLSLVMAKQNRDALAAGIPFVVLIALVIGQWLYFAKTESSVWQATLGKRAFGLQVTDLDGHRLSFGCATGRFFAKIVSGVTFAIGYLMAGFTEKKQALHDVIAGSLVIKKA